MDFTPECITPGCITLDCITPERITPERTLPTARDRLAACDVVGVLDVICIDLGPSY